MKKMTIRMTAIVLVLLAGVTIAQPDDIPKSCPSLPKQKAVPKKDLPRSPEQSEADRLVAEAQAAMRSPSCENVAKAISLKDYRGQNVLLIFYLGGSCTHCIAQLKDVIKRNTELGELDTTVLAVSSPN